MLLTVSDYVQEKKMSLMRANDRFREERMMSLARNYTYPQLTKQSNGTKVMISVYCYSYVNLLWKRKDYSMKLSHDSLISLPNLFKAKDLDIMKSGQLNSAFPLILSIGFTNC